MVTLIFRVLTLDNMIVKASLESLKVQLTKHANYQFWDILKIWWPTTSQGGQLFYPYKTWFVR